MNTANIGKAVALAAFCAAGAAFGFDLRVTVWRGESHSVIVSDEYPEISGSAPGIEVRGGTLMPVRYNAGDTFEYRTVADRAEYGSKAPGIHFATITAAPDAKPGEYRMGQLVVTVVDRVLPPPREWKYFLDLWQHPWAVARVNGVKPFSDAHYAAMEPLWRMLADAGQKALTVTLVDQPWNHQCYDAYGSMVVRRRGADGKWTFDYSVFDRYVEFGRKCGLGPDIACYTMCPWGYMVDYVDADGKSVRAEARLGERGWLKDAYIAMDERSPEDLAYIAKFVRRVAPGLKIAMAGNRRPSEFKGIVIDNYSQILPHVDAPFLEDVAARRREGRKTTYYVCCWPERPNTFMRSGRGEAFVCGFYPAACGLDGFLRWAYNSWGEDPMNDMTYFRWTAGDVALVYPDGSPSWRFLELRNGIVAAEKLRILREMGGRDAQLDALAAKFDLGKLLDGTDYMALRGAVQETVNAK